LSGVIVGERVWKVLEQGTDEMGPIGHGWTYSAHPVCAAAANANLDIVDGEDLTGNARDVGAYFNKAMSDALADHSIVGEVRGVGLLCAVEFVADKDTKAAFDPSQKVGPMMSAKALENGMITRAMPHGDILGFAPPLILTKAEADQIVDITKRSVEEVAKSL
jgi:L-2,4-diaminobutyrate transaminase